MIALAVFMAYQNLENNVISLIGAANTCWQFGE